MIFTRSLAKRPLEEAEEEERDCHDGDDPEHRWQIGGDYVTVRRDHVSDDAVRGGGAHLVE